MTTDTVVVDNSERVAAVKSATTGQELFECLQALPTERDSKSQGYSFNRFIKVMYKEGKLPPEFGAQNYGSMKAILHSSIRSLSVEVHGKDIFDKLKDSILVSYDVLLTAVHVSEPTEGVMVNRWALMAEFKVHPSALDALEDYHKKIPQEDKTLLLTDGMKAHRKSQVAASMKFCLEDVAPNISNLFGDIMWPALANIRPEKGTFTDVDQFSALLTGTKKAFDILKANLDKSGTQESGEMADSTALEFCKYNQRTCKLNHLYLWLSWSGKDLNYLSNNLQEGVATGGGEPAPQYSRVSASSNASVGSSVKSSAAQRKAVKGNHLEKVAMTISEVTSLQSMKPTSPLTSCVIKQAFGSIP